MAVPNRFIAVSNIEGDNWQSFEAPEQGRTEDLYLKSVNYLKRNTAVNFLNIEEANQDLKAFLEANP